MKNNIKCELLSEQKIKEAVKKMGAQITSDYKGKELVLICILKGSIIFTADLMRAIDLPLKIDFLAASSYGSGTQSSGTITIKKDIDTDIKGKHVLLVEDIIDSGNTLSRLKKMFSEREAASVKICTMLDKPARRETEISPDYCGYTVPDEFVVGCGLDFDEYYRNLPYIGVLKPEAYE
ncbi:MAG: hypoxanthine phosphoribosyltransferase [Oscillospiraceae bacterium]